MCSCHSILECCVMFSGVKLSIRSFVLFHGKVIGMLVVFLGYKILILVFFRVFWEVLCRNEILVFLGLLVFHIE